MIYPTILVATLASVAAAGRVSLEALPSYSFAQYVQDFRHPYVEGTEDYVSRKGLFESELKKVVSHNSAMLGWKVSVNKYSAMTVGEKKVSQSVS
jgi:hypothetical protein